VTTPETWATGRPAIAASATRTLKRMGPCRTVQALRVINQPGGYDCLGVRGRKPRKRTGSNRVVREELHGRDGQTLMLLTHMRLKWLPVIRDSGWR
jgi:hypothetical protein